MRVLEKTRTIQSLALSFFVSHVQLYGFWKAWYYHMLWNVLQPLWSEIYRKLRSGSCNLRRIVLICSSLSKVVRMKMCGIRTGFNSARILKLFRGSGLGKSHCKEWPTKFLHRVHLYQAWIWNQINWRTALWYSYHFLDTDQLPEMLHRLTNLLLPFFVQHSGQGRVCCRFVTGALCLATSVNIYNASWDEGHWDKWGFKEEILDSG